MGDRDPDPSSFHLHKSVCQCMCSYKAFLLTGMMSHQFQLRRGGIRNCN